jgi:CubicO group peptidase (beta-lactamase class C family)
MKKYSLRIVLVLVWIMISNGSYAQNKITARIDSVMQIASKRGIFNGNILVIKNGKTLYKGSLGYADASKKNKLSEDMLFDIGSITKEFNGTSIMILKERKLLSLDDPISKFFPTLPDWANKVKVRNLINYTSGIPIFDALANETDSVIWSNLTSLKQLKFEPGTTYIYNHYNVYLQDRIIEKLSGMSYAEFVRKNIFLPCKMENAVIDYPTDAAWIAKAFDNESKPTTYAQGMTGWVRLPAMDLYRWANALDNYKVITEESYKELAVNFPGGESSIGSTGFENNKLVWHRHQGSNSNYEALLFNNLKDSITVIMMTNNQQMKVDGIKDAIFAIVKNAPVAVPKKSVYLEIREKMLADIDKGIAYFNQLKANGQENYDFSFEIGDLISSGKYLQRRARYDDAIRLFEMAVKLDAKPNDISYGYELMGECYVKKNEKDNALKAYSKAVEIDPGNKNAKGVLMEITKK